MTDTTPQAAQVLTHEERSAIYNRVCQDWTNRYDRPQIYAAQIEAAILAKLQAATPAEPAQAVELPDDSRLLDALANPGWELSMNNEPECLPRELWQVHRCSGGRNDREWTLIGQGDTPRAAIDAALSAHEQKAGE